MQVVIKATNGCVLSFVLVQIHAALYCDLCPCDMSYLHLMLVEGCFLSAGRPVQWL